MIDRIKNSLSRRILFYFFLIVTVLTVAIFFSFEQVGRSVFKKVEQEKARYILKAIEPSIAMNLYLGFDKKIESFIQRVVQTQDNVIEISVKRGEKVVARSIRKARGSSFYTIDMDIKEPNGDKKIGSIHFVYSYAHFNALMEKYKRVLLFFLVGIAIFWILFTLYLNKLLSPLRQIAKKLREYTPNKPISFAFTERDDEIGAIAKALESLQKRVMEYAGKLERINKTLEKRVLEQTKALRERLYTDTLTGLANRVKLIEDIKNAPDGTLFLLNIDDFKEANDLFGHYMGDEILKEFASSLQKAFPSQKIYRLSGDEFCLFFPKKLTNEEIEGFITSLMDKVAHILFRYEDIIFSIRATIGIGVGKDELLKKADIALKKAKKEKKPFKILFEKDRALEDRYRKNLEWIEKIKEAIEKERVVPYFQAIVEIESMQPKGYECLMRMLDEEGKPISPGAFLDIAKKSRQYETLERLIVQNSCQYFQDSNCSFSLNISIKDILTSDMPAFIERTITETGVNDRVVLEILESEEIDNYEEVSRFLYRMKELGCKVAIDDFGSGYSNFEHILNLPIDFIKIDASLVRNIVDNPNSFTIVSAIVDIAKKKGIKTVAEFVSSEEILLKVREIGVDYAQGFFLAKPKPQVEKRCLGK